MNHDPRLSMNLREAQPAERLYDWREPTPYPFRLGVLLDSLIAARAAGAPDNANVQISGDHVGVYWSFPVAE